MMSNDGNLRFKAVSGFFDHDSEAEGPQFRAVTTPNLGLLHRVYSTDGTFDPKTEKSQWERFIEYLDYLNREGISKYKLFLIVRHGEGYHNVKEAQVGRTEWEKHWARLDGDGASSWFDAHLTEKGKQQAASISTILKTPVADGGIPVPMRHYTSPLSRCLETTRIAFSELKTTSSPRGNQTTVIKEGLRERIGVHTCDRRRTRSWIHEKYPDYEIEAGFTEIDELWKPDTRESLDEHILRVKQLLTVIFEQDPEYIVSLTAHSGTIRALYAAVNHRDVWVGAGAMVPVLIKADLAE
ncbi:Phosphomutase-like protein 3 [Cytospora mali]|uniref:Phosphomutase-like protein 3 n=1 Tax=Cytospora mali TaxID=578113 RepID=A0A194VVX5_CYTMA|nr:Phosphomutase-like protein 3 [Valsa mali]